MQKREGSSLPEEARTEGLARLGKPESVSDSKVISIVEAIKSVGPRNCSLISRMTGIPIETVRYKIKRQLLRKGITFHATVDYEMLGLKRYWVTMEFSDDFRKFAPQILDSLSKFGLTFYSRALPYSSYETMIAIPEGALGKCRETLDYMISRGILASYRVTPLSWVQHVSLRPEYYNFRRGKWDFRWNSLVPLTIRPSPLRCLPDGGWELDSLDLFVLKELQVNSITHLTSMAKKLGIGSKTLRYHYVNHVKGRNLLAGFAVKWSGLSRGSQGLVVLLVRVRGVGLDSIPGLEEAFLRLPFTWMQSYSEEESTFIAVLSLPSEQYVNTLSFLASSLPTYRDRIETLVLDTKYVMSYTVPYEMFDPDKGWHYDPKAAKAALDYALGKVQINVAKINKR